MDGLVLLYCSKPHHAKFFFISVLYKQRLCGWKYLRILIFLWPWLVLDKKNRDSFHVVVMKSNTSLFLGLLFLYDIVHPKA